MNNCIHEFNPEIKNGRRCLKCNKSLKQVVMEKIDEENKKINSKELKNEISEN